MGGRHRTDGFEDLEVEDTLAIICTHDCILLHILYTALCRRVHRVVHKAGDSHLRARTANRATLSVFSAQVSIRRGLVLRAPAVPPSLGALRQSQTSAEPTSSTHSKTYRPVLNPLVLDPPREPLFRSCPSVVLAWGKLRDRVCDYLALVRQRAQAHRVSRPGEVDK